MINSFIRLFILLSYFRTVFSNVEKTIFTAPDHARTQLHPGPHIPIIDSKSPRLRTQLHSAFPHSPAIPGIPSTGWYHLSNLKPGRRYEVRICWAAVTPAEFTLDTFAAEDVPEAARAGLEGDDTVGSVVRPEFTSELFLRIEAKAEYFTTNMTLMNDGLVVDVDIILDKYLFNLAPSSLLPTGLHILIFAVLGIFISQWLLKHIDQVLHPSTINQQHQKKNK